MQPLGTKLALVSLLLTLSQFALAQACTPVPPDAKLSEPQSIAAIENASLKEVMSEGSRVPQVPFGFINGGWESLKKQVVQGDTVHEFKDSLATGYLLLRKGCVVTSILTSIR